ncbi:hypothetical protein K2173_022596 [Erythroxylum novogranatense]|uniref:Putative zinc-finger domain-containing protein n=1 Tax=Erythroxylum novogranatense TaxID=1862640 RepID=A0AAV8TQL4_9ROSI|nr:hypothetical protein K2173_022596 [Erythroxylum novogranatense]
MNLVGHSKRHMQSLVDMEESLDKELEEAQELRRKCEIEERKALKAYRRAQRDLIEANVRCMELYNRRELYSAEVRSFLMNESSLLWSPRQHDHVGSGLQMGDNLTRTLDLVPSSRHQMLSEYDDLILPRCDTSIPYTRASPLSSSYQNINHQNLSSDPCSEPDASLSEPLPHNSNNGANGVSSPSNDPNVSPDDDEETSLLDHRAVLTNFKNQQNEEYSIGKQRELSQDSNKSFPVNGSSESLLLEATLRSELFARMGKRALSENNRLSNMVTSDDVLRTNEDNESERAQTNNGSPPFSEAERNQECEHRGKEKPERRNFDVLFHIQNNHNKERNSLEYQPADGSKVDGYSDGSYQFAPSVVLSPPLILRSVFALIQAIPQIASFGLQGKQSKQYKSPNYHPKDFICQENVIKNPMDETAGEICGSESGSFSCNQAIDPFWPLCLYELRGKCNNTACPSQHVRDFSNEIEGYHQHEDSHRAGCQVGLPLCSQVCNGAKEELKNHTAVIPTYLVRLDTLKTCPHSYESVVARRNAQCWQRCFSMCLCISSLPQIDMRADEPFLRGNNNRIEVHWSSNRQSSYFQSRNGIGDSVNDTISSNMKSLEMALLILNQDVNKIEGMKKALNVLSRALEADPASEILWILYLLIHGSSFKLVGKDDMFSYAVKYNEGSYVLWLMFINSRQHLDDRLLAYNTALAALCRHQLGSVSESDPASASACILDLFLQMMDWLCMSGKVEKAIQTVSGLLAEAPESDEPYSSLLSDILSCLMISDKYIFWVCCVYLVMYRKLPNAVINQFECTKELLEIEWPPVHLIDGEKESALKLLSVALDSVKLEANSESTKTEVGSRLAQKFALIHIRCIAAVDGLECSRIYLEKYMKLYPYCLDPYYHCIWNQYIEFVLQRGLPDLAKDLILQWFNSVSKVQHAQNENLEAVNSPHISLESDSSRSPNSLISESARLDLVFGFLNLSLAKLLQNDHFQARRAFDKVLKAAPPPYIKYCLREYARFMLSYKAQAGDVSISEQLNILNTYLEDTVAFFVSEPLSRRFINDIDKSRVQKLVSTILTPVSLESDLVNLCLEVWHGPSLLPQNLSQSKEMVDFVEAVLDMVPSNYQLAFSVFKKLSRDNTLDVTSGSLLFWACSTLVDAIFHAIPIAPECVWVEASGILGDIADIDMISERFYKRALSVYPFSLKLWHSYYKWVKTKGDASSVLDAAREKGIELS